MGVTMSHQKGSISCDCVVCQFGNELEALYAKFGPIIHQCAIDEGMEGASEASNHEVMRQAISMNAGLMVVFLANWSESPEEYMSEMRALVQFEMDRFNDTLSHLLGRRVEAAIVNRPGVPPSKLN